MMVAGPPKGGIEMPFETVHEGWSVYKVNDGAQIKMRLIMLKMYITGLDQSGNLEVGAASRLLFAVTVPPKLKGAPSKGPITPKEIQETIIQGDMSFKPVNEEWNEYKIDGVSVSVKVIATIISKSSKFDANGDPVYNVQNQPIVKVSGTPEAKRKLLKTVKRIPKR